MRAFLICISLLVSQFLYANTKTWTGNTSTNWATATNWSGNTLPASDDDIIIPTSPAGGRMPTISADYTVKSIYIENGASLTQTGGVLSVLTSSMTVYGTYSISGGTFLSDGTLYIYNAGIVNQSGGTVHLASAIGTNPTDHLYIEVGGNYTLSAGTADVKDLTTIEGSPDGIFTQSGGLFRLYHDFKNKGTFTANGGTIEFAGNGGGASFPPEVTSSNTQFHHVQINASVDPQFDNEPISLNVSGDWTNNSSGLNLAGKATTIIFNGTGAQTIGSSQATTFRNLTIDKPAGTATLAASQTLSSGSLVISGGTLDMATFTLNRASSGGTFSIANGCTVKLASHTGGQTGSNFPLNYTSVSLGSSSLVEYYGTNSITQTVYAGATYGHLTLTNGSGSGSAAKITTANITVNGNLTVAGNVLLTPAAANTIGGTGTLTGSGTVQVTRTAATADFNTQYPISNKTLSSLTVDYAATTAQTVNAHNYYNLTISGARSTSNVTLASSGTIGISGTFTPSATFSSGSYVLTGSTVDFNGSTAQDIPAFTFNNLVVSSSAKTAVGIVQVNASFTLGSNVVVTTTASNYLHIKDNGTATGTTFTAYVSGPVRKTGNDAFTFPVGKPGTGYMPVSISAPGLTTDAFTAEYMRSPGTSLGGISSPGLNIVSNCDYWVLDRSNGTATVDVTISWNGYSNCNAAAYVTYLPTLVVAHFNGTSWDSNAASSTTGNVSAGTVTRSGVSDFSPFGLGSTGGTSNPLSAASLQVKLISRSAQRVLQWTNNLETEIRNFEVERSSDALLFKVAGHVTVMAYEGNRTIYEWADPIATDQAMYYRIKAVDNSGQFYYSKVVKASSATGKPAISIYPNPVKDQKFSVGTSAVPAGTYELKVYDHTGQVILQSQFRHTGSVNNQPVLLPGHYKAGTYHLRITGNGLSLSKPFILQ